MSTEQGNSRPTGGLQIQHQEGGPLKPASGLSGEQNPAPRSKTRRPAQKTNAARYLDSLGIHYELREYSVDLEEFSAILVAEKIGLPPEQVFKTLLCSTSEREHVFAIVPGSDELDFKKLARACGTRKTEMASLKEVEPLTGYIRGGVTVFGARKPFSAYVDETIELFDIISVSAGARGLQLLLSPQDYLRAANASVAPLTKDTHPEAHP